MRSGSTGEAPGITTRTGSICETSAPGSKRSAMKSNPSATYASMIGTKSSGIA